MADLYELLGVDRSASTDEIKRAYRRKAREHHPDAGGDEDAFKEITHAYQVLSDPQKRARYDRFGDDGTPRTRGAGDPFGAGGVGFGGLGDVIDAFFGTAFGGGGGSPRAERRQPGRDVLVPVELTFEEVASGVKKPVDVEVASTCDTCAGSGSASGASATTCQTCAGSGQVQRLVRTAFGQIATASACAACGGTGQQISDPCTACRGEGRRVQQRTITVNVPPGVEAGDRLRVAGAGEAGRLGAASGDLYVEVRLEPHEFLERDGRDLWAEIAVPFTQAALGAELTVPTVGGEEVTVKLPEGSQPGDVISVRKAGLPRKGGGPRGDLHVKVGVEIPRDMNTEQRELLERLAELRGEDVPANGNGLFRKLREAFR